MEKPAPKRDRNAWDGRWLIVLATVFWSMSGLFAKAPFLEQWPADERGLLLAFWRAAFAALALMPFMGRPVWNWKLIPAAISFAIMNITFLLAMTNTTAANAIWLQYTAPIWVFLVGVLFLGERSVPRDRWMLLFGMLGVAVILYFEWQAAAASGHGQAGVWWGLAAGVSFAGVMLSLRQLRELNGFYVISVCHFSAAIVLLPFMISKGEMITAGTGLWLAGFGIIQMALPYVLFARGLRSVTGHEASCITLLEPILVPFWVYFCWSHAPGYHIPSWWTWLGASLILVGLGIRYWPQKTPEKPQETHHQWQSAQPTSHNDQTI